MRQVAVILLIFFFGSTSVLYAQQAHKRKSSYLLAPGRYVQPTGGRNYVPAPLARPKDPIPAEWQASLSSALPPRPKVLTEEDIFRLLKEEAARRRDRHKGGSMRFDLNTSKQIKRIR